MANPNNVLERVTAIVAMTIGSVTWAYIVGTMCALFSALNKETAEQQGIMDKLNDFMEERRLNKDVKMRLRRHLQPDVSLERLPLWTCLVVLRQSLQ